MHTLHHVPVGLRYKDVSTIEMATSGEVRRFVGAPFSISVYSCVVVAVEEPLAGALEASLRAELVE